MDRVPGCGWCEAPPNFTGLFNYGPIMYKTSTAVSYKVLARKWRPQHFRDMLGQEPVLRALANALDTNRLHHAYLFTGMRGVGKTTIARIFAKCLNCETHGVTSNPCGHCSACEDIDAGRFFDLIEVDAASRTKVESTRELLENVPYAPASGRYKVYLIDEVHMFSTHSFNALLKTLEEPPEHVKFVLATTDPQKVPATVLSRCLQFNLKRMPPSVLTEYLGKILKEESIEHERAALDLIARASEGSVRDSLSLVEQAAASGEGAIRAADVESMLGRVSVDRLLQLLETLASGDIQNVFVQVEELAQYAPDFSDLLGELLSLLHKVAMLGTVPGSVDENAPGFERLTAMASSIDPDAVQLFYQIGLHARRDMPFAPDQREAFDMALLRMHEFKPQAGGATVQSPSTGSNSEVVSGSKLGATAAIAALASSTPVAPTQTSHAKAGQAASTSSGDQLPPVTAAGSKPSGVISSESKSEEPSSQVSAIPKEALAAIFAPKSKLEPKPKTESKAESKAELTVAPVSQPDIQTASQPEPVQSAIDKTAIEPSDWPQLVSELDIAGMPLQLANHCVWLGMQPGLINLGIEADHQHLCEERFSTRLTQALGAWLGEDVKLNMSSMTQTLLTPAVIAKNKADDELAAAHESINLDPIVQQLVERVDGSVDQASIRPISQSTDES